VTSERRNGSLPAGGHWSDGKYTLRA
jgi:hypothetical protein